jgi:hypothetical protein
LTGPTDQQQAEAEVRQSLASAATVVSLPAERPFLHQERRDREQNITLKRVYALSLLLFLVVQIGIVDGVLFMYAYRGVHWAMDTGRLCLA